MECTYFDIGLPRPDRHPDKTGNVNVIDRYEIRYQLEYAATLAGLRRPKYLFIHIPKNGGMSIRQAPQLKDRILTAARKRLKSPAYSAAVLETMQASGDHPGFEHARLRDVKLCVRKANTPFAIVRNPWSRVVSRFTFSVDAMNDRRSPADYSARDFEAFLEERHKWGGKDYFWHRAIRGWFPQHDYVIDEAGNIAVDLLRLENLDDEFQRYFKVSDPLKRRNITNRPKKDYRSYYTPQTIQIVADWYARDIDVFGFDFDTGATRNTLYS